MAGPYTATGMLVARMAEKTSVDGFQTMRPHWVMFIVSFFF